MSVIGSTGKSFLLSNKGLLIESSPSWERDIEKGWKKHEKKELIKDIISLHPLV